MSDNNLQVAALREKSVAELNELRKEQRRAQFKLRMQPVSGSMPNPHEFKILRKNIARINTVLNEKG